MSKNMTSEQFDQILKDARDNNPGVGATAVEQWDRIENMLAKSVRTFRPIGPDAIPGHAALFFGDRDAEDNSNALCYNRDRDVWASFTLRDVSFPVADYGHGLTLQGHVIRRISDGEEIEQHLLVVSAYYPNDGLDPDTGQPVRKMDPSTGEWHDAGPHTYQKGRETVTPQFQTRPVGIIPVTDELLERSNDIADFMSTVRSTYFKASMAVDGREWIVDKAQWEQERSAANLDAANDALAEITGDASAKAFFAPMTDAEKRAVEEMKAAKAKGTVTSSGKRR